MSSPTVASSTELVHVAGSKHFPIKLTKTNFLVWRQQVHSTLVGLDLLGFVDGTSVAPVQFLDAATKKLNPVYLLWHRQDQILLGAILGSLSESVQPLISLATTAHEAWTRLTSNLASMSRSHIISLKAQLHKNPRGSRSIDEFIADMSTIAADLALAGSPVEHDDLIVSIMTQLGDEYMSIYQSLRGRNESLTIDELGHILNDCERQLQPKDALETPIVPTANYVGRSTSGGSSSSSRPSGHSHAPSRDSFRRGRG
ncbi:unnamed protein product [Cuscuta campestris]|uniref:Retrotransposon Copia-like N-terminal domain-containing protein n=1 Tax=Cuscuta campestris TaxID=132261 RepID=A0A484N298_9ASTE|nr:unnamed protein product [Cuscuta campestris]